MSQDDAKEMRRTYHRALLHGLRITWPILSGHLALIVGLGVTVSLIEGWSIGNGVYFSFVTGYTIGYGDLAPQHPMSRFLAVLIGTLGISLTGLTVSVAVSALRSTIIARERD